MPALRNRLPSTRSAFGAKKNLVIRPEILHRFLTLKDRVTTTISVKQRFHLVLACICSRALLARGSK